MEDIKIPLLANLDKITPEQAREYVEFVATLRLNQRRWFSTHNPQALETSKWMEHALDKLNGALLDPNPKLF